MSGQTKGKSGAQRAVAQSSGPAESSVDTDTVVSALAALAQSHRLTVFRLLVCAGAGGLSAGNIAKKLGIPATTLSFHLAQLSQAKLVHAVRKGRFLIYSANYETMHAVLVFLTRNCCQGHPEQCGIDINSLGEDPS